MASLRLTQCWRSLCVIAIGTTSVCCGPEDLVATRRPRAVTRPIVFNDNGAWSWFEDERAVVDVEHATLLIATVANRDGDDGAARHGDIEVVAYDLATGLGRRAVLRHGFEGDDHDSAALFVRADGRYLAMYSGHAADMLTRWRISRDPGDVGEWQPEQALDNGAPTTYSNVYAVPHERRLYAFVRSVDGDPHVLVSGDDGTTWTVGGRLLAGPDAPYVRYAADATGRIHLLTTEQHPREYSNGVYHGVIDDGRLLRSDGTTLDEDLTDLDAERPEALSEVFAPRRGWRAWTIDLQPDAEGHPAAVFSVRIDGFDGDHRRFYYYGRFDGSHWHVHPMAHAGRALYPAEQDYTGLAAIDPARPSHVVISTDAHPVTGVPLVSRRDGRRHYELFEGETEDDGATWCWTPLTEDSDQDNLRPVVPVWDADHTAVLWLRGTYTNYNRYDLDVVGLIRNSPSMSHTGRNDNESCAAPDVAAP